MVTLKSCTDTRQISVTPKPRLRSFAKAMRYADETLLFQDSVIQQPTQ